MKIVIIGGVAGGASAAARLRRLDENAQIIVLEKSGFVSYANCGLPYYIGGVIEDKSALSVQTPKSLWDRFKIDVRIHAEVISIDKENKKVTVKDLVNGGEYIENYDKLIIATGARPVIPELPNVNNPKIMTLRTVEDTYKIKDFMLQNKPRKAVVIGGGFIGLETAENLIESGIDTTLIQRSSHVMTPLDYDMACQIHTYLRTKGMHLLLNTNVKGFIEKENKLEIELEGKETLEADFVVLAIGVLPESELAQSAGLKTGVKGAIVVNEKMETSDPDIYAVGDVAQVHHLVTKEETVIALAGPANKQGRIAANNICGIKSSYKDTLGASVIKLFDMTSASTGLNETAAKAAGLRFDKVVLFSSNHAAYYPDSTNMTIKVLFLPETGEIIGAQIVGFDGVDKRIDVLSALIRMGAKAVDLEDIELAYAPPYSSAKDPVNMAGFVIENIRKNLVKQFHWHDLNNLPDNAVCLDIRSEQEFKNGHLPRAINIPLNTLRERLSELDKSKTLYVNCYSGLRSYIACRILSQNGFDCYNFSGGYHFYETITSAKSVFENVYPCGIKKTQLS